LPISTTDGHSSPDRLPWYRSGVVYQVYPRSFADGDGDGVGDLPGITAHLGHLRDLGVDAVWLSPFYRSPMADFGYDVSDHCDVDPTFGELADADALIAAAHAQGTKVVVDFVPNHVSVEHPWFQDALTGREAEHRDWFVWRDGAPDQPPNNWRAAFSASPAWTYDEASGQHYLHLFLPEQPDLDWNHPEVVRAMHGVLRFWLDRGVDGFRADVVYCIGKEPALRDLPEDLAELPALLQDFGPGTHEQLRGIRTLLESYPGDRMVVGETVLPDVTTMASYLGHDDELHLAFNFSALHAPWRADRWRREIEAAASALDPIGGWPTWTLSNHDIPRHRTRLGSEGRARAAAVLLLTLRGTPFLYMGEELGLSDAEVPEERRVDPGGRDGCRAPLPWTEDPEGDWGGRAWLPLPPDAARLSVEAQTGDPTSMLEHYRRLLALRRATPALHRGALELLDAPAGVLRYRRSADEGPDVEVAINFTDEAIGGLDLSRRFLGGTALPGASTDPAVLGPDEARITTAD